MTRFIAIVSGKGGVGKTTTAVNLGTAFASFKKKVLILDASLTTPNLGLYLGIIDPPCTFHGVINGTNSLKSATYMHASGFNILPGSIRLSAIEKLDLNQLKKTFKKLQGVYEIVIVDTGAGLTKENLAVINMVEEVLVVTNPELAAVTDALKTIKKSEEMGKHVLGVALNKSHPEFNEVSLENIESILGKPIIANIPESKVIKDSQAMKHPAVYLDPESMESLEFMRLAEKLK